MHSHVYAALENLVRKVMRRVDYCALYACTVQSQRGDGTLDLKPLDARIPPMTGIPIRIGIPGATVKVAPGAEVLMGFDGYRPDKPYAALWGIGGLKELTFTADTKLTIKAPTVKVQATSVDVNAPTISLGGSGGTPVAHAQPLVAVITQIHAMLTALNELAAGSPGPLTGAALGGAITAPYALLTSSGMTGLSQTPSTTTKAV